MPHVTQSEKRASMLESQEEAYSVSVYQTFLFGPNHFQCFMSSNKNLGHLRKQNRGIRYDIKNSSIIFHFCPTILGQRKGTKKKPLMKFIGRNKLRSVLLLFLLTFLYYLLIFFVRSSFTAFYFFNIQRAKKERR